ncbi:MAG: hypothetical protein K2J94_03135, partial [Duncaniella sp.]|nr:hypothetical protein [Duncaniella sp.]
RNIVERRVPSDFKDLVLGVRYKGVRLMPGARVPVNATLELEVGEGAPELMPDSIDETEDERLDLF